MKRIRGTVAKILALCVCITSVFPGTWETSAKSISNTSAETVDALEKQEWTYKTEGVENGSAMDLTKLGSYVTGTSNKDGGVAEIISYDSVNNKAWVVNGATGKLDIVDMSGITGATSSDMTATTLDIKAMVEEKDNGFAYGDMTSVCVNAEKEIVAVALQAADYDKDGMVALLTTAGEVIALLEVGCQPDMVTFTPDGNRILVANEGEPRNGIVSGNDASCVDPKGSVTVIEANYNDLQSSKVTTIGFEAFDSQRDTLVSENNILVIKGQNPSTDFEPEYIACDNEKAYITLQEANAVAVLNLNENQYEGVYSLGYKDLSDEANGIDLVEDGVYQASTYENVVGAYMPDGIATYKMGGKTYIVTANEGDAREWGEEDTPACYVNEIKENLVSTDGNKAKKVRIIDAEVTDGLPTGKKVLFGGRSFSIYEYSATGLTKVFDSANDLEEKTAAYIPDYFNCSNDDNEYDSRSPKKGVEPESVTIGVIGEATYAFVALERISGIMMYDITDPAKVKYVNYINTRDFGEDPDKIDEEDSGTHLKSDVAPEGLYFIPDSVSPSKTPILLAAFEVSGTVAAYGVDEMPKPQQTSDSAPEPTPDLTPVPAPQPTPPTTPQPLPDKNYENNYGMTDTQAKAFLEKLEQGKTAKVTVNTTKYTMKKTKDGNLSVTAAAVGAKVKNLIIPAKIEIGDITYPVTAIGAGAFKNQKKITKVTFPNTMTTIGKNAFSGCTGLKTVKMSNSKIVTISSKAFYKCTALKSVSLPGTLKIIGNSAFYGCKKMKSIVIPAKVNKINAKAFYGCTNLKKVTIKSKVLKTVGSKAFKKTKKGIKFSLPKSKKAAYKKMLEGKY